MRHATPEAFRAALEQRLLTRSRDSGVLLARLRKLVAFDRLIARLVDDAPDRWIIKGGVALELRYGSDARMTRDLDLGRGDTEDAATADLMAALAVDLGDYFRFAIRTTAGIDDAAERVAVRYRIASTLAGRRFEEMVVDIGFGGSPPGSPEHLPGTNLLEFAGFAPVIVPVVSLDQHVAEKIHAYTRIYDGQRTSSRVKDLIDLVLIQAKSSLAAGRLRRALIETYADRGVQTVPTALPIPPPSWASSYPVLAVEVGVAPDVAIGHRLAAAFLDPVLNGTVTDDARWDPARGCW